MTDFLMYAYWNGEEVRTLFESVAAMTSTGDFAQLASFCVLMGLVMVLVAGSVRAEGRHAITYSACVVFFWFATIYPKVSLTISDTRSETVYVVDHVPLGIGFFASVTSRIGYWLANTYETAFAPVDVARFSRFGAVYPERVLSLLNSVGPVTQEARTDTENFTEACILPEVITDPVKGNALRSAADLWSVVTSDGWVNPARTVALSDGSVTYCREAVAKVNRTLEEIELPRLKKLLGARLAPGSVDPGAVVSRAITQSEGLLLNLSRTMNTSLKHSIMLSVIPGTMTRHLSETNAPMAMAVTLAKSQGNLASEINYRTMADIARDSLPKIRNALEFIVIALFPVAALLALTMGQAMGNVLRGYVTILLTVQLWPAVASVVNHLMITIDTHPFAMIANEFGGNSLAAISLIRETGASSQAIAGGLMCAVPIISYALVRAGDMALSQLVGGLTAPAQSAASMQGATLAAGNISQGNVQTNNYSGNNVSANALNRSVRTITATSLTMGSAYGSVTRDAGGLVTGISRTGVSMGLSQTTTQSYGRNTSTTVSNTRSVSNAESSRYSITQAAVSTDLSQKGFASALREAISENRTLSSETSRSVGVSRGFGVSRGSEFSRSDRVSESTSVKSNFGIMAFRIGYSDASSESVTNTRSEVISTSSKLMPLTTGSIVSSNGKAGSTVQGRRIGIGNLLTGNNAEVKASSLVNLDDVQGLIDTATGKTSTATKEERSLARSELTRAAEGIARTNTDEGVRSAARSFIRMINSADTLSRDQSTVVADSGDVATMVGKGRSAQTVTSMDRSVGVMQEAIREHGSAEGALRALYTAQGAGVVAQTSHDTAEAEMRPTGAFGPQTMVSTDSRVKDVYEESHSAVTRTYAQQRAFLEGSVSTMASPVTEGEMREGVPVTGFEQTRDRIREEVHMTSDNLAYERGVLMVSNAAYRQSNADKNFALRNAFVAAWGYRTSDELADGLRSRSENNPELKSELIAIGYSESREMDDGRWKRLIRTVQ